MPNRPFHFLFFHASKEPRALAGADLVQDRMIYRRGITAQAEACGSLTRKLGNTFLFAVLLSFPSPALAEARSLARAVPGDARIFVEVRDVNSFLNSPSGEALAGMLENFFGKPVRRSTSQPATIAPAHSRTTLANWQRQLANAVGLTNGRAMAMLLSGRLAIAADGWNGLDDAVLLAEPIDAAALEKELQTLRVVLPLKSAASAPAGARRPASDIHRYALSQDHELACDGRMVVLGRVSSPSGLYTRTTGLWQSENGIALNDLAEFVERTAALPQDRQILFFISSSRRIKEGETITDGLMPGIWPELKSFALSVMLTPGGVIVDTAGRVDPAPPLSPPSTSANEFATQLPISTVAAWAQKIDYVAEYRRINRAVPNGVLRFYLDVLQTGLPNEAIEQRLLAPLVGDTIWMIGQMEYSPPAAQLGEEPLQLPAVGLTVKTDDVDTVARTLQQLAANFLGLLNVQAGAAGSLKLLESELESGGTVYSIPIGEFFASRSKCEFLRTMQISWTVADRRLIAASHQKMVEKIANTRRGLEPAMTVDGVTEEIRRNDSEAKLMMVAQPLAASEMIDSWVEYLSRYHPEMLRVDWWQRVRVKQRAASAQLGILPAKIQDGAIEVAETLPNWPAHDRLLPGDRIIAVDGHRLDAVEPQRSLRTLMVSRRDPNRVVLGIIREDCEQEIELPMRRIAPAPSGTPPIELLAQAANLLRIFSTAHYAMSEPAPGLFNARLDLHFAPTIAAH